MDFKELGLALKEERERQGLSIEVVMESTKISRTNIVAIENGDRSSLPHPVYAKGFIKSYARYLGLDAEELSMVVDREYQDEADGPEEHIYEVSPAAEKAFQDGDTVDKKSRSIWPLILVLVVLVIAGGLVFMNLKPQDPVVPAPAVQEEQMEQPAEMAPPAAVEAEQPAEQADEPAVEAPEAPATDEGAVEAPAEPEATEQEAVEEETAIAEESAEEAGAAVEQNEPEQIDDQVEDQVEAEQSDLQQYDHVLIIRATTEKGCWVGVWKGDDTQMSRDFVLREGEPLRLLFNSPRRIRIGNVAGVVVTYNGEPYQLDSNKSNIQTLRFGF